VNVGPKRDIVETWAKVAVLTAAIWRQLSRDARPRVDEFLPVRYDSDTTGPLVEFLTTACRRLRWEGQMVEAWTLR